MAKELLSFLMVQRMSVNGKMDYGTDKGPIPMPTDGLWKENGKTVS